MGGVTLYGEDSLYMGGIWCFNYGGDFANINFKFQSIQHKIIEIIMDTNIAEKRNSNHW